MRLYRLAGLLACCGAISVGGAQVRAPADGGTTVSLGQPRPWKWTAGIATGSLYKTGVDQEVAQVRLGVYRDIGNAVVGLLAWHGEAYLGGRDRSADAGLRLRIVSPFARFGGGVDYNAMDGDLRPIFSLYHHGRRGGLFRDGTAFRLDYLPSVDHSLAIGIEVPMLRRTPTGSTRPRRDHVRLSNPRPVPVDAPAAGLGLAAPVAEMREAATWIRRMNTPFLAHAGSGAGTDRALLGNLAALKAEIARAGAEESGIDFEVRRFHAAMERAFAIAAHGRPLEPGEPAMAGRAAAARARAVLLDEVLLPYDALIGQVKRPDNINEFAYRARGIFIRWLYAESGVPAQSVNDMLWVFTSLLDLVEANRAAARAEWGDSRFVWLPLQYGLLPEDHDTQAELDAIIERATGEHISDGNYISYVLNEQFQYQLSKTIHDAREYHVLWTHDYRGFDTKYDGSKRTDPDEMAFRHTVRSYLAALTARVRAYDTTGTMPTYIVLLDEWFYAARKGRLWLSVLEDPTRHQLSLPDGYKAWEDTIAAAQQELRAAIAGSALLQAQARQYGDDWLRNLIKVHINITNAADPSFWSWRVIRGLPLPDNMMRDHRKIVFYDLTEEDPQRGAAMFTGAGVGEHYANRSWEDRSIMVRGPAAVALKDAARALLRGQGMSEEDIPHGLQRRAKPANYDDLVRAAAVEPGERVVRAVQFHNETGFGAKDVNVAKGVLYTLMPAGSVIKIPDSMWNSPLWGSALLGASLRGVRALIIAPSDSNHPVGTFGPRILARELLLRLLTASQYLDSEITSAGGLLKIGVYNAQFEVTNLHAKASAVSETLRRYQWLRDLYEFSDSSYEELRALVDHVATLPRDPEQAFEYDPKPRLHLKANFFASREAWTLMRHPKWGNWAWDFVNGRVEQLGARSTELRLDAPNPRAVLDGGDAEVADWYEGLPAATRDRVIFYSLIGSQNQNNRSVVSDGEDALMIADLPSVISYLDFITLAGQSVWIETAEELDTLIPPYGWLKTWFTHWFRLAM